MGEEEECFDWASAAEPLGRAAQRALICAVDAFEVREVVPQPGVIYAVRVDNDSPTTAVCIIPKCT